MKCNVSPENVSGGKHSVATSEKLTVLRPRVEKEFCLAESMCPYNFRRNITKTGARNVQTSIAAGGGEQERASSGGCTHTYVRACTHAHRVNIGVNTACVCTGRQSLISAVVPTTGYTQNTNPG